MMSQRWRPVVYAAIACVRDLVGRVGGIWIARTVCGLAFNFTKLHHDTCPRSSDNPSKVSPAGKVMI